MTMKIFYTPHFLRLFKKLPVGLQDEVEETILLFLKNPADPSLRVHKLKGVLKNCWSMSVTYDVRIVFQYDRRGVVAMLAVGDHAVYE